LIGTYIYRVLVTDGYLYCLVCGDTELRMKSVEATFWQPHSNTKNGLGMKLTKRQTKVIA